MWVAKLLIFFSKTIRVYAIFNDQSFNDILTNDMVSFEHLGPVYCNNVICQTLSWRQINCMVNIWKQSLFDKILATTTTPTTAILPNNVEYTVQYSTCYDLLV